MQHYEPVSYKYLATHMTHPLIKLMLFVLLISNEGQVKRLLLLYNWIIQHYLSLFSCNWRHISLLGPCISITLTAIAIKWK